MTSDWRMGHDFGTTVHEGKPCKCGELFVAASTRGWDGVLLRAKETA